MNAVVMNARNLFIVFLAMTLVACSGVKENYDEIFPDEKKVDYKKAKTIDTLEVPPDMSSGPMGTELNVPGSGSASFSQYSKAEDQAAEHKGSGVLNTGGDIRIVRDGNRRWMVIKGTADQVWPELREFWLQTGFLIETEDPRIGIMETDWAENRADIPDDFIRSALGKVFDGLYSAATRDKYRVRLEKGAETGTTELYLTHYGAEEVVEGDTQSTVWKPRPADPELEIEMMRRMAVFFGVEEKKSRTLFAGKKQKRTERAKLFRQGDTSSLSVLDDFPRAWRRTGLALDRIGFTVEDRDRSKGVYFVRYVDPLKDSNKEKGFLDKFKIWGSDKKDDSYKYQISLKQEGDNDTRVTVNNDQGQPEKSKTAYRILSLLHEQLK
jgi:outer membrane protein assembly factor BamC